MSGHSKVKRDPKANWPTGWEVEVQRLAKLYERTTAVIKEFDKDLAKKRRLAQELKELKKLGERYSRGLQQLVDGDDADHLFQMHCARSARSELTDERSDALDRFLVYVGEIRSAAASSAEIVADLDGAVRLLLAKGKSNRGNQSTLALRFTIAAAAVAYKKLFGKSPGRSRSDPGTFGRFVGEIIAHIPPADRPMRPSPSAISEVVKEWELRQCVAPRSG